MRDTCRSIGAAWHVGGAKPPCIGAEDTGLEASLPVRSKLQVADSPEEFSVLPGDPAIRGMWESLSYG